MKKYILIVILAFAMLIQGLFPVWADTYTLQPGDIVAEAAILIDQESGQILFQKNINKIMYPASITKIMTAILVLEDLNLDDTVVVDAKSPFTEGNRIYVIEDEIFTVEQLLNALMIESANDAAVALATYHSGSVEAFAKRMNERAQELGALNTNFVNPNGLPDEAHVTTAYDMALIAMQASKMDKLMEIASTVRYEIPPTNKQSETRYMTNSNRFLYGVGSKNQINYNGNMIDIKYDAVTGLKTGYTVAAGQTFVATGEKDGKKLISVILKSEGKNLYIDTRRLLDYGFDNFERKELIKAGEKVEELSFDDEKNSKIPVVAKNALVAYVPLGTQVSDLTREMNLLTDISLPIESGALLGTMRYLNGDMTVASTDLVAPGYVSDKALLDDTIDYYTDDNAKWSLENMNWMSFAIRAGITLLIWRSVMTWYNLQRRNYAKKMRENTDAEKGRTPPPQGRSRNSESRNRNSNRKK